MRNLIAAFAFFAFGLGAQAQDEVVRIYNWSDYIDPSVLRDFTEKTGIKVVYDVYDNNDILEAKIMTGHSGYDLVVPSSYILSRDIPAGVFEELDKTKISNWGNLDSKLMQRAAAQDPGNKHAFIYMWGTSGLAFNSAKIKEIMPDAPVASWRMLFDPAVVSRFKSCGVYMLDSADEGIPAALNYIGLDPNSTKEEDFKKAQSALAAVRPNIRKFHSSEDINALANGDICLAMIYSGDAGIAAARAKEAHNGVEISYAIPQEGAQIWFDMMAMLKDAPDKENAYKFMNFLLEPQNIAKITNAVTYPNAVLASLPMVKEAIRSNPNIYPPDEVLAKLYTKKPWDQRTQRMATRIWRQVATGD